MPSQVPELFTCPACKATNAVVALERYGIRSFYCPDCNHGWDDDVQQKPPTDRPEPG
jgi:transposase-like protein